MNLLNSLSLLDSKSPVILVANTTDPEKPMLITPFKDAQGNPKTDNNGNPIGSIRLEQTQNTLNGGFLNSSTRVAFIGATIKTLEKIINDNKLKAGSVVPGKIVIEESLTPFYPNQKAKINPNGGAVIQIEANGALHDIYMRMRYTDKEADQDFLLRSSKAVMLVLNANTVNKEIGSMENKQPLEEARIPVGNDNQPAMEKVN